MDETPSLKLLQRLKSMEDRIIDLEKNVSDWQCVALLALCESRALKSYTLGREKLSGTDEIETEKFLATLADTLLTDFLAVCADSDMRAASHVKSKIDELRKKKSA